MTATPVRLAGRIEQVGVELAPGAVASALGVPAHSLRGGTWDLNDVAGAWAQEWLARLFVTGPSQRIDVITALLAERMRSAPVPDWRAAAATKALTRHPAGPGEARGVSELAERNGLSARQLEQVFRDTVGLSPREMRRLSRFHRLCRLLGRHETSAGLAGTALEAGYSDQAHASRETKRISGLTLKQMRDRGFVQDTPDRLPED